MLAVHFQGVYDMKVTINGFVYHRQYSWEDKASYEFFSSEMMCDADRVLVLPHSIEVDIPDDFTPIPGKIEILRKEKQRILAQAHVKAENIEAQIQELLCIEDKSVRCPECGSENWTSARGFTSDNIETFYKVCDCGHQWDHQ